MPNEKKSERIIKETDLLCRPSRLSLAKSGRLTLTNKELIFTVKKGWISKTEEILYDIPVEKIRSVDATKVGSVDALSVRFEDKNGKVTTLYFENPSVFSRTTSTTNPEFVGWAETISKIRER